MLRKVNLYYKNFYKELGLSQHFTWKGFFRRTQRLYPRTCQFLKFGFTFSLIFLSSSLIIPGSSLPFQRQIKLSVLRKTEQIAKLWYVQAGIPDITAYLSVNYYIINYLFDNGLVSIQNLSACLSQTNSVLEPTNNYLYRVKNGPKLDNILGSVNVLKRVFKKFGNEQQIEQSEMILKQYNRIVENSVIKMGQLKDMEKKDFAECLRIFEYLLRYGKKDNNGQTLKKLIKLLQNNDHKFVAEFLIKDEGLKRELKSVIMKYPEYKSEVGSILKLADMHIKSVH